MVSRSVSTCAYFLKHYYTLLPVSIRQLDLGMSYSITDGIITSSHHIYLFNKVQKDDNSNASEKLDGNDKAESTYSHPDTFLEYFIFVS